MPNREFSMREEGVSFSGKKGRRGEREKGRKGEREKGRKGEREGTSE